MIVFAAIVFIGLVLLCVAVWKTLRDPDHRIPPVTQLDRDLAAWKRAIDSEHDLNLSMRDRIEP
jgi:hypothetical protein